MGLKDNITKGVLKCARGTLLYGPQGIGKSTFASHFPSPMFFTFEKGTNDLDVTRCNMITTIEQLLGYLDDLLLETEYKTLVIDGIDGLAPLIEIKVVDHFNMYDEKAQSNPYKNFDDIGWGKNHNEAARAWHRLLKYKVEKIKEAGIDVVLLGHSQVKKFDPPDSEAYDKYDLRVSDKVGYQITAWCDEVLFCNYRVDTRKSGNKHEAIGKGERILYTQPRPQYNAKTRLDLPAELPLSYEAYAQHRGA